MYRSDHTAYAVYKFRWGIGWLGYGDLHTHSHGLQETLLDCNKVARLADGCYQYSRAVRKDRYGKSGVGATLYWVKVQEYDSNSVYNQFIVLIRRKECLKDLEIDSVNAGCTE